MIGGIVMVDSFDIGAKVRIKETFSKYPGEQGIILSMGTGQPPSLDNQIRVSPSWLVQLSGTQEEIPEHELELTTESTI
jgi:hypothetical protein